jgi:hypothetical protein
MNYYIIMCKLQYEIILFIVNCVGDGPNYV